jgi:hypothetical protein
MVRLEKGLTVKDERSGYPKLMNGTRAFAGASIEIARRAIFPDVTWTI